MPRIHPTAFVEGGAELADDVEVGAYAVIGPMVRLGAGTVVRHHATIEGRTTLGAGNLVFPYAYLGGKTQDLKYKGGEPGVVIGDHNTFREYCTVHTATAAEDVTRIGHHNHFLAYSHIAHDCVVGNRVIMSNASALAGHVVVEDHVVIGGYAGIHQFCRVGAHAMVGGMSKLVLDAPPFFIADGNPATVRAYNKVGLERAGYTPEQLEIARLLLKVAYFSKLNRGQALDRIRALPQVADPMVQHFLRFYEASQRGVI